MKPVVVIHGGAGAIPLGTASPERERAYHAALQGVLASAQAVLARGGSAIDAVSMAVVRSSQFWRVETSVTFASSVAMEVASAIELEASTSFASASG